MLLIGDGLKRELSKSEFAISHFHQTIEHGGGISKACREVLFNAMKDFLEMIDDRDDSEDPLQHHAVIALPVLTKPPADRLFSAFAEPQITEDFRRFCPCLSDLTNVLVVRVRAGPSPVNDLTLGRNQPAEVAPHNPALVAFAFLAGLGCTAAFTDGVNQLNYFAKDPV